MIDVVLTWHLYLKLNFKDIKSLFFKVMLLVMGLAIFLIQSWQLYIEFIMNKHEGWMSRYQDLLPVVASCFN